MQLVAFEWRRRHRERQQLGQQQRSVEQWLERGELDIQRDFERVDVGGLFFVPVDLGKLELERHQLDVAGQQQLDLCEQQLDLCEQQLDVGEQQQRDFDQR